MEEVTKLTRLIDPVIGAVLVSSVDRKFYRVVKHHILAGGKRLRPALAVICCRLLGGKTKDVLWPAVGLEVLHNYTLIVDDIIDKSPLRRGKLTVWKKFGKSMAECASMYYAPAIFQSAVRSKNPVRVAELFAKTLKTVVNGEILDILFEQSGRIDEPYIVKNRCKKVAERDYFAMVGKKTASLFKTCCEVGGICGKAKEKQLNALKKYGYNLGMAFQIQDDILDIFGQTKKFGKKVGHDITERKCGNIVVLLALKELKGMDKKRLLSILRKEKIGDAEVKRAVKLIKKTNSRKLATILGQKFAKASKNNLAKLPQNKNNKLLADIADLAIAREK